MQEALGSELHDLKKVQKVHREQMRFLWWPRLSRVYQWLWGVLLWVWTESRCQMEGENQDRTNSSNPRRGRQDEAWENFVKIPLRVSGGDVRSHRPW